MVRPAFLVAQVERPVRVLEDRLHLAPQRLQLRAPVRRSRGRRTRSTRTSGPPGAAAARAGRRLAAARLHDQPERLAADHVERDAVDGFHGADLAAEEAGVDRGSPCRGCAPPSASRPGPACRGCPCSARRSQDLLLPPSRRCGPRPAPCIARSSLHRRRHVRHGQTSDLVASVARDRLERRMRALVLRVTHVRAAGMERAAAGQVDQRRRAPGDQHELLAARRVWRRGIDDSSPRCTGASGRRRSCRCRPSPRSGRRT